MLPGAPLVSADIASDMSGPSYEPLLEIWLRALAYADMPPEKVEEFRSAFGTKVAVLPPADVADLIASAGFEAPVQFFQSLLMHGWFCRRAA